MSLVRVPPAPGKTYGEVGSTVVQRSIQIYIRPLEIKAATDSGIDTLSIAET